jgi:hypothetical protein
VIDAAPDHLGAGPALAAIDAPPMTDAPPLPAFADEPRDDAWAKPLEADLREQLGAAKSIKKIEVECRTAQCKLVVQSNPGEAMAAADAMESMLRDQAVGLEFDSATGDQIVGYARFAR